MAETTMAETTMDEMVLWSKRPVPLSTTLETSTLVITPPMWSSIVMKK